MREFRVLHHSGHEIRVRGLSFSYTSTSTTIVCSTCMKMWALPSTFLIADFVNLQVIPSWFSTALTSSDEDSLQQLTEMWWRYQKPSAEVLTCAQVEMSLLISL